MMALQVHIRPDHDGEPRLILVRRPGVGHLAVRTGTWHSGTSLDGWVDAITWRQLDVWSSDRLRRTLMRGGL